jgi:two-component system sensor histidine kinase/response regulator
MRDRHIVHCNRRMDEIFGYAPGEQIGQPTRIWYASDEEWARIGEEVYRKIWQGENHQREAQVRRKDGSPVWVRMSGRALDLATRSGPGRHHRGHHPGAGDARGGPAGAGDGRGRRPHEVRLPGQHEPRDPHPDERHRRHGLPGPAHRPDARQRDYLEKIQGAGQHLLGIINDILDLSRIEAGKLVVEHIPFSLERMIVNVTALLAEKPPPRASS